MALFGSILFHRLSGNTDLSEKELSELKAQLTSVLNSFDLEFAQYELLGLPESEFPLGPCSGCGLLTGSFALDDLNENGVIEHSIREYIQVGTSIDAGLLCRECDAT